MNIHVRPEDDLKPVIDRLIAEGRVTSEEDHLRQAARRYAEDVLAENDLVAIALEGIAEAEAVHYTVIQGKADSEALFHDLMARARATVAAETR